MAKLTSRVWLVLDCIARWFFLGALAGGATVTGIATLVWALMIIPATIALSVLGLAVAILIGWTVDLYLRTTQHDR